MNFSTTLLAMVFTYVILSLLWARFSFFKVKSKDARIGAIFYDPVATIHIAATYYSIFTGTEEQSIEGIVLACMVYICGLLLFWWGINTAKALNYAFGEFSGKIITSGPFRHIRHPFYTSYTMIWLTSTLLFNSLLLWITLVYLVSFYLSSAMSEESAILSSKSADIYRSYCKKTNRFIPRIKTWKS